MNFNPLKYSRIAPISTAASLRRSRVFPAEHLAYHRSQRALADAALRAEERANQWQGEVDHERGGGAVHHGVHLRPLAAQELDGAVADEARAYAVRDGVREGHQRHGQERRKSFLQIADADPPADLTHSKPPHHQPHPPPL